MQVRTVAAPPALPTTGLTDALAPVPAVMPLPVNKTPPAPKAASVKQVLPVAEASVAQSEPPIAVLAHQAVSSEAAVAASPAATEAASAVVDEHVPVYRTRTPPAANLRFVMQRGILRGNAELSWRPSGKAYELRLDGRIAGLTILSQVSQGGFDSAGIADRKSVV